MELTSGIVCMLDSYKRPVGTGFVVSAAPENLIITCAHVLDEPRPEQVTIVFQATGEQREAKLIDQWWRPESTEDVAVLQVVGDLPEQVQPFRLGTAAGTRGHTIHTFGFPNVGEVEGVLGTGEVLGLGAKTKAGQPLLQVRSTEITSGFSGAPLWDEARQRVVGMVVIVAKPDASGKLGETAFATSTETLQTVCPILRVSDVCPYRNLAAFTEADAAFFFGRKQVVDELVNSLRQEPRFLVIFGPSGSGKSSIVQAGLLPELRLGRVPGSDHWQIMIARPTDRMLEQVLSHFRQETQKHMVLIIDQFEELFVAFSEAAYQEIVIHLTRLLESSSRITLILVMRDDFYSQFGQQETLARWLRRGLVNVPPTLKRDEVVAMIQEPARAVGLHFQEGLTEVIVDDVLEKTARTKVTGRVGSSTILPLLEFALTQLWERRQDGVMTRNAYEVIGGVTGALARWADREFYSLNEQQRALAGRIFTDLVYLGNESQGLPDSRQRRSLVSLARRDDEREIIRHIVGRLIQARLLVANRDDRSKDETVEIIHEALLHEWEQLKVWIREDHRFLRWYQKFKERFQEWVETNAFDVIQRDTDRLLRGRDLSDAEDWLKDRGIDLNREEQDFIHLSREQRTREEEHLKTLLEESERQRQIAAEQRKEAQRQQRISLARSLASQAQLSRTKHHQLELSVLLAIESLQRFYTLEAYQVLFEAVPLLRRCITSIPIPKKQEASDYDQHLTTSFNDSLKHHSLKIFPSLSLTTRQKQDAVFNRDWRLLATARSAGVDLWEVESGQQVASFAHKERVLAMAFTPDGHFLVIASESVIRVWNVATKQCVTHFTLGQQVKVMVFNPDVHLMATSSGDNDNNVCIWNLVSGKQVTSLFVRGGEIEAVTFSPQGHYLAAAGSGIDVWSQTSRQPIFSFGRADQRVSGIAFSSNEQLLAITIGVELLLWDFMRNEQVASFTCKDVVSDFAFSPDGDWLAIATWNVMVELWYLVLRRPLPSLSHQDSVFATMFDPTGQLLATASRDQTIGVWKTNTAERLASLACQGTPLAFSPDGHRLATSCSDAVKFWPVTKEPYLTLKLSRESSFAFSPDGVLLAASSEQTKIDLWNTTSGQCLDTLADQDGVCALAFSSDGHSLFTVDSKMVRSWDIATRRCFHSFPHQGVVKAAVFSSDKRLLATIGNESVCAWEMVSGHQATAVSLKNSNSWEGDIVFSSKGRFLALWSYNTFSSGYTIELLDIVNGKYITSFSQSSSHLDALIFGSNERLLAIEKDFKDDSIKVWDVVAKRQIFSSHVQSAVAAIRGLTLADRLDAVGVVDERLVPVAVHAAALSFDERFMATSSDERTVSVWQLSNGQQIATLLHRDLVRAITFRPDGRFLFTATNGTVAIWDTKNWQQIASLPHQVGVQKVTLSPDGRILIIVDNGFVRLWLYRPEDLLTEARNRLNRNFTQEEWKQYLGDEPYRKICPHLP
jgi:WD40 repeat protein/energy-coupling factor transporter ATP-binding protein EcfA2